MHFSSLFLDAMICSHLLQHDQMSWDRMCVPGPTPISKSKIVVRQSTKVTTNSRWFWMLRNLNPPKSRSRLPTDSSWSKASMRRNKMNMALYRVNLHENISFLPDTILMMSSQVWAATVFWQLLPQRRPCQHQILKDRSQSNKQALRQRMRSLLHPILRLHQRIKGFYLELGVPGVLTFVFIISINRIKLFFTNDHLFLLMQTVFGSPIVVIFHSFLNKAKIIAIIVI